MKQTIIKLSVITSLALVTLNASTIESITNWSKYPLPQEVVSKSKGGLLADKEAMKDGVGSILIKSINGNSISLNNEEYNKLLLLNKDKLTDTVGLKELIASGDIIVDASTLSSINGNGLSNPTGLPVNGTSCDDNNPLTTNDVYTNNVCLGTSIVGTSCDDLNANTSDDKYDANGVCVGILPSYLSCKAILDAGLSHGSGMYEIDTDGNGSLPSVNVECDMITDGGGWTVFQKRINRNGLFNKNWNEYVNGFFLANGEYWLGLENLYQLTSQSSQKQLYVKLNSNYAKFSIFYIGNASTKYVSTISDYSGTAGNGGFNVYHTGKKFSTYDQDNDVYGGNCSSTYGYGGWWMQSCLDSNLNSTINTTGDYYHMYWGGMASGSINQSRMMVR